MDRLVIWLMQAVWNVPQALTATPRMCLSAKHARPTPIALEHLKRTVPNARRTPLPLYQHPVGTTVGISIMLGLQVASRAHTSIWYLITSSTMPSRHHQQNFVRQLNSRASASTQARTDPEFLLETSRLWPTKYQAPAPLIVVISQIQSIVQRLCVVPAARWVLRLLWQELFLRRLEPQGRRRRRLEAQILP